MKQFLIFNSLLLLFVSCGYRPITHYTERVIDGPVYLDVVLSRKDPENGLFLRDELYRVISTRLRATVTDDKSAKNQLKVTYNNISYRALSYDTNGYVNRYRANVTTTFDFTTPEQHILKKITESHEADVTPQAIESLRIKQKAIQESTRKAVDQFVAYFASQSVASE